MCCTGCRRLCWARAGRICSCQRPCRQPLRWGPGLPCSSRSLAACCVPVSGGQQRCPEQLLRGFICRSIPLLVCLDPQSWPCVWISPAKQQQSRSLLSLHSGQPTARERLPACAYASVYLAAPASRSTAEQAHAEAGPCCAAGGVFGGSSFGQPGNAFAAAATSAPAFAGEQDCTSLN